MTVRAGGEALRGRWLVGCDGGRSTVRKAGGFAFAGTDPEALAERWGDRIAYVAGDARDRLGLSAVLVRPDGVVAWAGEDVQNPEDVAEAASRWFGEPDQARGSA